MYFHSRFFHSDRFWNLLTKMITIFSSKILPEILPFRSNIDFVEEKIVLEAFSRAILPLWSILEFIEEKNHCIFTRNSSIPINFCLYWRKNCYWVVSMRDSSIVIKSGIYCSTNSLYFHVKFFHSNLFLTLLKKKLLLLFQARLFHSDQFSTRIVGISSRK